MDFCDNSYLDLLYIVFLLQISPHFTINCLSKFLFYYVLFKKQLFDLEAKGQGPTKAITVRDTPSYDHAPTYQISLIYLERQKSYGPDNLRGTFDLKVK
jgi:hypothetical protein